MAEEMVPIVDEDNNIIEVVPRSVMRKNRLPHRASYIVLQNSDNKFYVELRTKIKDYCPGMLDACVGGVFAEGEDIVESGKRELKEELGVTCDVEFLGWKKLQSRPDTFVYAGLFYAKYDGEIIMQESEVDDVYLKSFTEIVENDKDYTPDSVLAIKEVVKIKNLIV